MEGDIQSRIKQATENKDINTLENIKNEAEMFFEGDIVSLTEKAIAELNDAEESVKISQTDISQIENNGGSLEEMEEKTKSIDDEIKSISENSKKEIEGFINNITEKKDINEKTKDDISVLQLKKQELIDELRILENEYNLKVSEIDNSPEKIFIQKYYQENIEPINDERRLLEIEQAQRLNSVKIPDVNISKDFPKIDLLKKHLSEIANKPPSQLKDHDACVFAKGLIEELNEQKYENIDTLYLREKFDRVIGDLKNLYPDFYRNIVAHRDIPAVVEREKIRKEYENRISLLSKKLEEERNKQRALPEYKILDGLYKQKEEISRKINLNYENGRNISSKIREFESDNRDNI